LRSILVWFLAKVNETTKDMRYVAEGTVLFVATENVRFS